MIKKRIKGTRLYRYREPNRQIDYQLKQNRMIAELAKSGFSVRHICRCVNQALVGSVMSECQVIYRLGQLGIKLKPYRDGETDLARQVTGRIVMKLYPKTISKVGG